MSQHAMHFINRTEAGRRLAAALARFAHDDPVVLGLWRGGLPVAAPIAAAMESPLDTLIVRKVGAPFQAELGIGALAEGDVQVIDTLLCQRLGITDSEISDLVRDHSRQLDARVHSLRSIHPRCDLTGRVAIIVDDGLATGATAHAAVRSVLRAGASRVIVAAPVGSAEAVQRMADIADEVVCLSIPYHFGSVGQHYEHFEQLDDTRAMGTLGEHTTTEVEIPFEGTSLHARLTVPPSARLLVVFAHGSGSSRLSPRNRTVARILQSAGIATLLMDLLTEDEASERRAVFDVELLANRLEAGLAWTRALPLTAHLGIGLFGASTGAAAALAVAARCPDLVSGVVSRGGRPDLATTWLPLVHAPTLLIVGGDDVDVLRLNREALSRLRCPSALEVVPGAGHLFEEPGALERTAVLARDWFARSLASHAA